MRKSIGLVVLAASALYSFAAPADNRAVQRVTTSADYKRAIAELDQSHDRMVAEIITLTEIPAPPFEEAARAAAYRDMLQNAGLSDVEIDAEGNVLGLRRGSGPAGAPLVVIAAHLDTVFPASTNVKVRREGTRLYSPGIGDDTRSLAVLLAYVRALDVAGIRTKHDILFVGNVGEEGQGDLRGMRYLFGKSKYKDRVKYFLSMDSTDAARIVNQAVGSKRYRISFKGPGGHSYGAFGLVNPMVAMSRAIVELYATQVPSDPRTTYAASVTGGGTSVNSIPNEVFVEFDMRSADSAALAQIEKRILTIVPAAVEAENGARSTKEGRITADLKQIGDRPAGVTSESSHLVQLAVAAVTAQGLKPRLAASSTDSNIPISLGIPAITIGSGGKGGRAHSLDEWIDVERTSSVKGMSIGLSLLLALAEMQ